VRTMHRFKYSVTTKAWRPLAWEIYTNWKLWNRFANVYGDLHWRGGKPWDIGSSLQIEVRMPVNTIVDHQITSIEPHKKIGWTDRARGIILRQMVEFVDMPDGKTQILTWGEFSRPTSLIAGRTVAALVTSFTETWYENFRLLCDQFAEATTQV
jgi:hypothetical protein